MSIINYHISDGTLHLSIGSLRRGEFAVTYDLQYNVQANEVSERILQVATAIQASRIDGGIIIGH